MFRKLRIRFIAIASLAILIVLFSVVGVLNSARHIQTVNEINKILTLISDNGGTFPSVSNATSELGNTVSVDTLFQYRYFSAVIDEDGNITSLNSSNISDLTDEQVENYLTKINKSGDTSGDFRYHNLIFCYYVIHLHGKNVQRICYNQRSCLRRRYWKFPNVLLRGD